MNRAFDSEEGNYSDEELASVRILNDRIYGHKVLRVNYTTYDMRRAQDSINPRTHPDIMVLSSEDEELRSDSEPCPYWYSWVIGIYHVEVKHDSPNTVTSDVQHMEFLWVRWFGQDPDYEASWRARHLHHVGFVPDDPLDANDPMCASDVLGFINLAEVICGVHLILAFAHRKTTGLLGPSIAHPRKDKDEDWQYSYINMYVHSTLLEQFFL